MCLEVFMVELIFLFMFIEIVDSYVGRLISFVNSFLFIFMLIMIIGWLFIKY